MSRRAYAPWSSPATGVDAVVERWRASGYVRGCITADRGLGGSDGAFEGVPDDLSPGLAAALRSRGIDHLYDHQARAVATARARTKHVVVATPTASGKSLCFHLPVLDALAKQPGSSAIYLYPTKALARDQEAGLRTFITDAGLSIPAIVYDGDTPGDARRAARERCPIVMTNPDMLHAGILPHHAHWAKMFQGLRYVVIDELHTYRGVFGSHVAHVLARLRRAADFHGSKPVFLCATATIANPAEHAARLLGVEPDQIEVITESGAPRGERRVLVVNPPIVNAELGVRASTLKLTVSLAADLVRARVPTIVFGQSRSSVEIMLKYLRDRVGSEIDGAGERLMAYRGGYLPETRRKIERGLREGEILCVVATNALELGIDIGDLDAVVCAGYPGSIAGTWQRFGRAGRRGSTSLAVLVATSSAVDQYLARNPSYLLDGAIEGAGIDPENTEILIQHMKCAAFELPFVEAERYAVLPADETREALTFLAGHGVVHESAGRFHWSADAYPASHVSLRTVGWDNFVIIDKLGGAAIAELDYRAAHTMLHEQAIYQHDGEQYQVERLDFENHKAFVRRVDSDYFTTALTNRKVSVIEESARSPFGRVSSAWGEISLVEKVVGYKKVKFFTHENAGYGEVRLPDMQMHTTSFWLTVPHALCEEMTNGRPAAIEGLRGIAVALETVATIALMCDPRDLSQAIGESNDEKIAAPARHAAYDPTLFLFDNVPGGVGLAERIYDRAPELLGRARELIRACDCPAGCPMCVGPTEIAGVRKAAALELFERLYSA